MKNIYEFTTGFTIYSSRSIFETCFLSCAYCRTSTVTTNEFEMAWTNFDEFKIFLAEKESRRNGTNEAELETTVRRAEEDS